MLFRDDTSPSLWRTGSSQNASIAVQVWPFSVTALPFESQHGTWILGLKRLASAISSIPAPRVPPMTFRLSGGNAASSRLKSSNLRHLKNGTCLQMQACKTLQTLEHHYKMPAAFPHLHLGHRHFWCCIIWVLQDGKDQKKRMENAEFQGKPPKCWENHVQQCCWPPLCVQVSMIGKEKDLIMLRT